MSKRKKNLKGKVKMNIVHFRALTRRYFDIIFSDKLSFIMTLLQAPLMLLVILMSCQRNFAGNGGYDAHTALFVIIAITAVMGTLNSYREICKERDVFAREYHGGLDATAYVMSKFAVQAVLCFVHSLILTAGTLFIIDFPIDNYLAIVPLYLITIYLVMLSSCCLGLLISALLKNSESAILPILLIIMAQMVLSNTIIRLPEGALTNIVTAPIVTKWGVAALGHMFNISGTFPHTVGTYAVYSEPVYACYIAMISMILLSLVLSIVKIKKEFK